MAVKPSKMRPPVPGWLNQIQFILSYAFNPCDATWVMWIDAAQEPVHDFAMFLIEPDLTQILQSFFTPKGLRSKRHGRKGRRGHKKGVGIPDVDEMIAEKLPGAKEWEHRVYRSGTRSLFVGLGVIDEVQFSMAMVEKTTDTVFNTFVGLVTANPDVCPNRVTMLRGPNTDTIIGPTTWSAFSASHLEYQHGPIISDQHFVLLPEGQFIICVAAGILNDDEPNLVAQIRLQQNDDELNVLGVSPEAHLDIGETAHIMADASVIGPGSFTWRISCGHGNCFMYEIQVWVMQII